MTSGWFAMRAGSARDALLGSSADDELVLAWLGQAGFLLRQGGFRALIDPYLSNYLETKYQHHEFSHERMMPVPIQPCEIRQLDVVLCTHAHSDHMDPETLSCLADGNPHCSFVVPAAEQETARRYGVPPDRVRAVNAGQRRSLSEACSMAAVAAAHEEFEINARGEHRFLGYILSFGDFAVYHSGDTVAYDGLAEVLRSHCVDVALLPVNGRDSYRRRRGIAGNMNFEEAIELCRAAEIGVMIPHHFGMFSFNTVNRSVLNADVERLVEGPACFLPSTDRCFTFRISEGVRRGNPGK